MRRILLSAVIVLAIFSQAIAATRIWRGDAPAVAQVTALVFAGTWETNDVNNVTINGKVVNSVTGSATIATLLDTLVTALNASTIPEFAEITWSRSSSTLLATSDTAGKPFAVSITTTETGGGAADAQTIDGGATSAGTATTANSGPYVVSLAANWVGGTAPTTGDDIVATNTNSPMLYNLDAFTAETFASFTVTETVGTNFRIGLPRNNTGTSGSSSTGYVEYRATYFEAGITTLNIRGGSGRLKFNCKAIQTTVNVLDSGAGDETNVPTVLWKGTHASNVVNVTKGSFGAAFYEGETSVIATLRTAYKTSQATDANVYLGGGCTLTTITKVGGAMTINSSFTTLNQDAGETVIAAGAPGTVNVKGGQVRDRSSGNVTAIVVFGGGEYDLSQDARTKTITNVTLYASATFRDPGGRATFTNPIVIKAPLTKLTLEVGSDFGFQRS